MSEGPIPSLADLRSQAEKMGVPESQIVDFVLKQQTLFRDHKDRERDDRAAERNHERELSEIQDRNRALEREHEIRVLTLQNQIREGEAANQNHNHSVNSTPLPRLPSYSDGEDITAYLIRFERIASLLQIDRETYAIHLGSLLSGKALQLYSALCPEITNNFEELKRALLAGFNKTPDSYREEFRHARINSSQTYEQFAIHLGRLFDFWVDSKAIDKTFNDLREFILMDQFLSSCNPTLRTYLKENNAGSLARLTELSDNWTSAHKNIHRKPDHGSRPFPQGNYNYNKSGNSHTKDNSNLKCFGCGSMGHTKAKCPQNPLFYRKGNRSGPTYSVNFSLDSRSPQRYMTSGSLNGTPVSTIVRDTGCNCIIVSDKLLPDHNAEGCETVVLSDYLGREDKFPLVKCYIKSNFFSGWVEAVKAPIKLCSILIGNVPGASPVRSDVEVGAVTRSKAAKGSTLHPLLVPKLDPIAVDSEEFRCAQSECETLENIRVLANSGETHENSDGSKYGYEYGDGILYRKCIHSKFSNNIGSMAVVVPEKFRRIVLSLGHESPFAGHYGHRKTETRVKRDFFWPGISRDTRVFCRSCDKCQRMSPRGNVAKAPLKPMPIISVPFSKVAIDIVGPLSPPSSEGHRYILTLIDFATGFPEGIPLKEITSISVAEALVQIFSRVGIPREILSDNGRQFTSQLMGELHKLLGVKPLFASPYHPMGNGRIERLHSTLKACLRKLCAEKPRDWHRYLIPTLFSIREMPSDRTGFSPFELLYGRQCRGPMAVLRDLWVDPKLTKDQRSIFSYVIELQEKLKDCAKIAAQNAKVSVDKYKTYFDLKSQNRQLNVGDETLVLLPAENNKLLMTWRGPYKVKERRGKLNYIVSDKGKDKIFHINLLKKYHRRATVGLAEISDSTYLEELDESGNAINVCHAVIINDYPKHVFTPNYKPELDLNVSICKSLDKSDQSEIASIVDDFEDVLTSKPGCTDCITHDIELCTSSPIRAKHYPIPLHLKADFDEEIDKLLNLGFIQPSKSPYSSPCLLVKKSDNTYRLVVDYRELNSVTIFDAEPPCSIEEELYKFHDSKIFTELDITKAYWQIKLTKRAREYTAFPTSRGLMEWVRMPFGLVTAVASYIRLMRIVLRGIENVTFYFDNIFIYSTNFDSHIRTLREVLERLRQHGLTANPSKCFIGYPSLNYLGFEVGEGNIQTLDENISSIVNFEKPKSKKLLRSFLGLFSFYRKFVNNPAELSHPLNQLLKDERDPIKWSQEAEESFVSIKTILSSKPVLKLPNPSKSFILRTDASSVGLGCVLMQYGDEDIAHPIAYAGRSLLPAERNYSTIERECLSMVWAINKFKYYLIGKEFILEVDHKPLIYLNKFKGSNSRLMRWAIALQPYRFSLVHIPGKENVGADLLSRNGN